MSEGTFSHVEDHLLRKLVQSHDSRIIGAQLRE